MNEDYLSKLTGARTAAGVVFIAAVLMLVVSVAFQAPSDPHPNQLGVAPVHGVVVAKVGRVELGKYSLRVQVGEEAKDITVDAVQFRRTKVGDYYEIADKVNRSGID